MDFFFKAGRFQHADGCPGCSCTPCEPACPVLAAEAILRPYASDGERRVTCYACGVVVLNRAMRPEDHLSTCTGQPSQPSQAFSLTIE